MKKTKLLLMFVLVVIMLAGCAPQGEVNKAPSVVGVKDVQCIVNSTVDFLDGVAALDKEDGDITPNLKITVTPHVDITDGYATFTQVGEYTVNYQITDSNGRSAQKRAYVDVVDRETYRSFAMPEGFVAQTNGSGTIDTCGMINGVFKLNAHGGEIAEDIRLVRVFTVNTNVEYTFNYTVKSNVAGKVKVTADGDDCAEIAVAVGENTLSFTHTVRQDDEQTRNVEIALCLGTLDGNVEWQIGKVDLEYPQEEGALVERAEDFNFAGRVQDRFDTHDGTNGLEGEAFSTEGGVSARLRITNAANDGEIWRGGMFINTGITLRAGVTYTVSFNVERDEVADREAGDYNYEVVIQNKQWDEYKFEILRSPNGTITDDINVNESNAGSLWIYVQSATQENQITVSELSVKEHLNAVGRDSYAVSDFTEFHNDKYNCEFSTDRGNFKYVIESFSATDNEHTVTSPSFFIAGSGGNYVISFKAKASAPIEMIVAAPVYGGWDPTLMWSKVTLSAERDIVFTFFCNGNASDRLYTIVWQFGSPNNQRYENVTIEITDIRVCLKNGEID